MLNFPNMFSNVQMKDLRGFSLSLIASILWGVLPIALKELIVAIDATTIVWFRFLLAGIVLTAWLFFTQQVPSLRGHDRLSSILLILAASSLCLNYFLFSYSLNFVNGETSEAVIQLTTLFLIIGSVAIYGESFVAVQRFGTFLIVAGLLLFFNERLANFFHSGDGEGFGVMIVVFAAVTWTVYALIQKKLLKSYTSVQILWVIYMFSLIILLPFISPSLVFSLTGLQQLLLFFCCVNTLIAYGSFAEAMNCWDASKVSAVLALAPLFTIGSLKLIVYFVPDYEFSDRLAWLSLGGAGLLVLGSVMTAIVPLLSREPREAN